MNLRHTCLLLLISLVLRAQASATAQVPDRLYYQGQAFDLFANPLEAHPEMERLRAQWLPVQGYQTSCWRGYVAEWTLTGDVLWLTAVRQYDAGGPMLDLKQVFGAQCTDGRVRADWVTGPLPCPQGEQILLFPADYASLYERQTVFSLDSGRLREVRQYDNSASRKSVFSDPERLREYVFSQIRWESIPFIMDRERIPVALSGNAAGQLDSIRLYIRENTPLAQELLRVLRTVPEWDIWYNYGKAYRFQQVYVFVFTEDLRRKYQSQR